MLPHHLPDDSSVRLDAQVNTYYVLGSIVVEQNK